MNNKRTMKQKTTRFALTLLLSVLTAATAWADDPSWLKSGDSWDATTKTLTVNTATVAPNAYWNNSVIENVIISNGVTSIGGGAFASCHALESVTIYATSVPTLGSDVFSINKSGRKIFVPTASLSTYKSEIGRASCRERV